MRYVIWGPVLGITIGSVLFLMGVFGLNGNLFLITTGILAVIGAVAGWYIDKRIS